MSLNVCVGGGVLGRDLGVSRVFLEEVTPRLGEQVSGPRQGEAGKGGCGMGVPGPHGPSATVL